MDMEPAGDGVVIHLPMQFYQAATGDFLAAARKEIENKTTCIVIDFSKTTLIDSSAIGALVAVAKESKNASVRLVIRDLSGDVRELFIDTGLDKIFNVESDSGTQNAEIDLFEKGIDIRLGLKQEVVKDVCIFNLSGVMNHPYGSRFFKQEFLIAMANFKKMLLNLEDLTFFDSLSVSVVLNMNKLLKETGGAMRICGANYIVADLFNTLNISQIIPIYNVVTDALDDWM